MFYIRELIRKNINIIVVIISSVTRTAVENLEADSYVFMMSWEHIKRIDINKETLLNENRYL